MRCPFNHRPCIGEECVMFTRDTCGFIALGTLIEEIHSMMVLFYNKYVSETPKPIEELIDPEFKAEIEASRENLEY